MDDLKLKMPESLDMPPQEGQDDESSKAPKPVDEKEITDYFKGRIDGSKKIRKTLHSEWKRNVDLRVGKTASVSSGGVGTEDQIQVEINPDWALTKTKTANLFSRVPLVGLTHENRQYAEAVPYFGKALNYEIGEKRANLGAAMEEVLNDVVNASGIGAIYCSYTARFENKEVPAIDTRMIPPEALKQAIAQKLIPMTTVPQVVSYRFNTDRISPSDLLWPAELLRSDFDKGDWAGFSGRMSWAEGVNDLGLTPDDKEAVLGQDDKSESDDLRVDPEKSSLSLVKVVKYDHIFYWRYKVDPEEKHLEAIWELIFVEGKTKPVIHRAYEGQKLDPQLGHYVGVTRFPVRYLTLTYITDNPVPPSDSSVSRPQTKDMQRSRQQMFANRARSIPIRWFDVNRIGPEIQNTLMRGSWQGMIPTNGDGNRAIGEIARASYPSEDLAFDQTAKSDLYEMWQLGPSQVGGQQSCRKPTSQIQSEQQNFATRIGQERAHSAVFFLGVCDVVAGLMALYSDFPMLADQERQTMQQNWDNKHILHDLVFKIRPDSTIVLDTQSRLNRIYQFINMTAKSGVVDVRPLIIEAAELSDIDPTEVIIKPQPKPPEEPNLSYRFSGKDDLMNPIVMAMLMKHGKAPNPQELEAAKQLLMSAANPPAPPQPPAPEGGGPPTPVGEANPEMSLMPKVAKRSRDMGAGS